MSKDGNRGSAKLYSYYHGLQNNIAKNDNISAKRVKSNSRNDDHSIDNNELFIDTNQKRLNKLRRAINTGRFKIDCSRVAEKFIQFESQLSI